jgi:uncharacterized SAM-binding protein YcdF (DUF218 family)
VLFFPLKVAMKVISLLITAAIAYLILSAVQVVLASRASTAASDYHRASAIVLLGAPAPGGTPGTDLTRRLETAASLYQAHLAGRVVVTGSGTAAASAEGVGAATTWLTSHGIPGGAIESVSSTDAVGGLKGAAATLGRGTTVLVVTDAIDALWTKGAAASAGLTPQIVPAADSKVTLYTEIGPLLRQTTGVAAGRIIGDLRATWAAT